MTNPKRMMMHLVQIQKPEGHDVCVVVVQHLAHAADARIRVVQGVLDSPNCSPIAERNDGSVCHTFYHPYEQAYQN